MYQSTKGLVWNINALVLLPLLQFLLLFWPILWGFRTSSGQAHTLFLINSYFPYFFIGITDVDRARVIAVTCHSSQCRSTTFGVTCYNNVNWRGREKIKTWHISKRLSFFFFHYDCAIIIFALVFFFCGKLWTYKWYRMEKSNQCIPVMSPFVSNTKKLKTNGGHLLICQILDIFE